MTFTSLKPSTRESEVPQSCLTLWNPMDCSLPVSSVRGILQAGILEWVAISFSKVNRKVISHQSTQLAFPPGLEEVESNMKWLACVSGLCPMEKGFPGLSGQESARSAGAAGVSSLIPGPGRSPGGGNGNPLQYSWLESPTDRGAWRATVHGVADSQTRLRD